MEHEIQYLVKRYPELDPDAVRFILQDCIEQGLSPGGAAVMVRMILAEAASREELYTADDLAAVLGCGQEEAHAKMEKHGVQGMRVTAAPGFEWALGG